MHGPTQSRETVPLMSKFLSIANLQSLLLARRRSTSINALLVNIGMVTIIWDFENIDNYHMLHMGFLWISLTIKCQISKNFFLSLRFSKVSKVQFPNDLRSSAGLQSQLPVLYECTFYFASKKKSTFGRKIMHSHYTAWAKRCTIMALITLLAAGSWLSTASAFPSSTSDRLGASPPPDIVILNTFSADIVWNKHT